MKLQSNLHPKISFIGLLAVILLGTASFITLDEAMNNAYVADTQNVRDIQNSASVAQAIEQNLKQNSIAGSTYTVTRIIDGDTIEATDSEGKAHTIRYIGIDTPETVHPTKKAGCFGSEASARNKGLVYGKTIGLEMDTNETDQYGRLLRYVYVEGQTASVNELLVASGHAKAISYPPDTKLDSVLADAQRNAKASKLGIWSDACQKSAALNNNAAQASAPIANIIKSDNSGTCDIKGNINSSGEKIFHVRGCGSYANTTINENAGERWFCSEQDALQAGWRKAKNC